MHWIAPSEKDINNAALEKRLWDSADLVRLYRGEEPRAKLEVIFPSPRKRGEGQGALPFS